MKFFLASLLCLTTSVLSDTAEAKRIYSFKDDKGVMHFSDRPPPGEAVEVAEQLVKVDNKKMVYLREEGPEAKRRYLIWNGYGGPIEILLSLEKAENVVSEPALPASVVVPAQQTTLVMQVEQLNERLGWSYQWNYSYVHGDPRTRPDPNAVYQLPFDPALKLRVHQAFGGSFSHTHEQSFHAVDIPLAEGTPVRASRAGVVMASETDFYASGTDMAKYGSRANEVRIVQEDGTMAVYAHLELESVVVAVGDRVRAGQVIAKSGNTGFSTGPHLHFVVQRNAGGKLVSIPFQFTIDGKRVTPTTGMLLAAPTEEPAG